jgi:hypothetical protein
VAQHRRQGADDLALARRRQRIAPDRDFAATFHYACALTM